MEKNECEHLYGEVVEVLPSEIHKVMAGSDFPILLYKCNRCGKFFQINGFNFRHANTEEIKHFKELDSKDKFYKMEECKPVSSVKRELIEKACIVFRNALIDLALEKRIDASLIDYNIKLFVENLGE